MLKKRSWGIRRKDLEWYVFLSPLLVMFVVFLFYPLGHSFYLSFTNSDGVTSNWVGLRSYSYIIRDRVFMNAFYNTFYMAGLIVIIQTLLALVIANELNKRVFTRTTLSPFYILPYVTTLVASATIWVYLFDPSKGSFNWILRLIGFEGIGWLGDPSTSKISVIVFTIWRGLGYYVVIYLVGLQAIPQRIYEAASIDGANSWQMFFRVTIPLVSPITIFIVMVSVIGNLKKFMDVYIFGGATGNPARSIQTVVGYIYEQGFYTEMWGLACAAGWLLFAIIFVITIINTKVLLR